MKKPYENLLKKYDLSLQELQMAIEQIPLIKIHCSVNCLVALVDLLCSGDIEVSE